MSDASGTPEPTPNTPVSPPSAPLAVELFGVRFQNPVLLAAGTCGFGEELQDVADLDSLGGLVTKSVTLEPRAGNAAPRLTELHGAMLNSVGLANPGVEVVCAEKLPWLRRNLRRARVVVSLAGHTVQEFARLVEILDRQEGFHAFELNLSCPNDDRREGATFAHSPEGTASVVTAARERTQRPILAKLAPDSPQMIESVEAAEASGADAITLVNTLPGLALDPTEPRPALGAGAGGVSGPALFAAGLRAVWLARSETRLPLVGVGGISTAEHARDYLRAGASLVQIGTASFANPRTAERIVKVLARWAREGKVTLSPVHGATRAGAERGPPTGGDDPAFVPREAAWQR